MRVFSMVFALLLLLGAMCGVGGCASEALTYADVSPRDTVEVIKNLYWRSERVGLANVSVRDSLAKSDVDFKQSSSLYNEQENVRYVFKPSAYLYARLSKSRVEALTKDELSVVLENEYIESRTPYKSGTTFGEDVVKIFEFSNGMNAKVFWGYRYTGVVVGNDTLAVPHVEAGDVVFIKQTLEANGEKTETEEPYKAVLGFQTDYTIKGTSGDDVTSTVLMNPWYQAVVTAEATKVLNVAYEGRYVNCPVDAYELVEMVTTNKGEFSNTYRVPLAFEISQPQKREQPSLDSLFNAMSVGKFTEKEFSQVKNEDGFTIRTMTGNYLSANTGKVGRTAVESTVGFTYQYPVKFESEYGKYDISPLKLNFEEIGFEVKKISENKDSKLFRSVNTIEGTLGTCALDLIEEVVDLRIQREKAPNVVRSDSTYVLKGSGDDYVVEKTVTWSDGSKTTTTYDYKGRHSASATPFGNKVTTSLNWNENTLQRVSQSEENDEKKFSSTTKFSVVYTTSNWRSDATNGVQSGAFAFTETSPVVTFIDGEVSKTFPQRKYTLTGAGAEVASNFTMMALEGVSYKAYAYDYVARVVWNDEAQPDLVSGGYLLMSADETGEPVYSQSQSWNGNTVTVKVTKTTPHTQAQNDVETYTKDFTIGLGGLTDGNVYAENTNFSATETHTETNSSESDGPWTVESYKRDYAYKLSNGAVTRDDLKATATDAVITFNDGTYSHTFNVRLNVTKNERLSEAEPQGEFDVTTHFLTVSGVTADGKSISDEGKTTIFVKRGGDEPEPPHLGRPKEFHVTATYDPTGKVTRRAFVFNWEDGVSYAVCDYEMVLPDSQEFVFKQDDYSGYNSVGYDKNNSTNHWQPARGVDSNDAIRWYFSNGALMSAIDKALSCKVLGWKNIVNGDYALVIPGYTYEINGYDITVKAPNGQTVTFNSHYNP